MATKSKFFRVAVEGATTDGRTIQRTWIEQIAKNFNQATYGARVWLEHFKGVMPDGPFKAYGDVTAVKAEEAEINGEKKLALFAQIDATPDLVAMNKARQKIYSSLEINPNFAGTGEAYLVGLGVTDTPASLGTEMLAFAANANANPLADRKQAPDNLFTEALEVALEFDETPTASPGDTLFTRVKELLGLGKKDADERFADVGKAVETVALSQKQTLNGFARIEKDLADLGARVKLHATALDERLKEFADLKAILDKTEDRTQKRPPAKGGNGSLTTDC